MEVIWSVHGEMGRSFLVFLYNYVDSDHESINYQTGTVSYSYLLRRNLRMLGETTYDEKDDAWRFVGGIATAF